MNSLKLAHELGKLIARRKTGETGEFSYVCLRSGEERNGRGEILELVKQRNREGWEIVRNSGGGGETDKEFEGKIRKLVAKLPWEKSGEVKNRTVKETKIKANAKLHEENDETNNMKQEKELKVDKVVSAFVETMNMNEDTELKMESEFEETINMKEEKELKIEKMESEFEETINMKEEKELKVEKMESELEETINMKQEKELKDEKMESKSDAEESENPDADMIASMHYKFACMSETCDKMFIKWGPCKKHMVKDCFHGQNMVKQTNEGRPTSQQEDFMFLSESMAKAKKQMASGKWSKGGKMSLMPSEQDIVQAVEQFYASLNNRENRKHVLGHIGTLYGTGEFRRFGYGTFIKFSKRHGLEVYGFEEADSNRKEIIGLIRAVLDKKKSQLGTVNFFCKSCGCDLNENSGKKAFTVKRKEARVHMRKFHRTAHQEITRKIVLYQLYEGDCQLDFLIEESFKGQFEKTGQLGQGSSMS
eukprot:GFUD01030758.1.p1 GENE.GFUD01030758.1~~GFUD01030758.1.p1  ORF type:complete len:479 (+),score=162.70 GFUD01030758.1:91-1527(+)